MEGEKSVFVPSLVPFTCSICHDLLQKPVTLSCGHTHCHYCILSHQTLSRQSPTHQNRPHNQSQSTVPVCPDCQQIIWRPPTHIKENVVIANLMSRYNIKRPYSHPSLPQSLPNHPQHYIQIELQEADSIPMPHCYSHIIFTTAFLQQINEQQQSEDHPVILKWPQAPQNMAIAGRISRPQIYHLSSKTLPHESTFRAQFKGMFFVKIKNQQRVMIKFPSSYEGVSTESPLTLCEWEEFKSIKPQPIEHFSLFFNVYDQLNNPIFIRQISHLIDQRVLHSRDDPQGLIYCMMRVLRLKEKDQRQLIESMDDQVRWEGIESFIRKNMSKTAPEIIRVNIPGNYSNEALFIFLLVFVLGYYLLN